MSTSKENKTKVKKQNYFIDGCCRMKLLVTGLWKIKRTTQKQDVMLLIKLLSSLLVVVQPLLIMLRE